MRIIKHGSKTKTRICFDCGCEFEFTKSEEKNTWINSPFDNRLMESYHWINCPECGKEIEV